MTQDALLPAPPLPPTPDRSAGLERLKAFTPKMGRHYASQRNFDFGPADRSNISMLSGHARHRLVLESELAQAALEAHGLVGAEKFIQEVCWRTYWKGWLEQRPSVWTAYVGERDRRLAQLEGDAGLASRYDAAITGRTGLACFDAWATELIDTGYLHNHARMWFASIWIYTLDLPWALGADHFLRHLIDGDAASNTLSWRWVCGLQTVGKTYLARASNINKYSGGRFQMTGNDLASDARPLDPDLSHPAPGPLEPGDRPDPSAPAVLVLHEEDLHPESWGVQGCDIHLIAVPSGPAPRGDQPLGAAAQAFTTGALADAAERAQAHFGVPVMRYETLDDLADAAREVGAGHLILQRPQQGPVADRIAAWAPTAPAKGLTLTRLRRDWDKAFHPHATKGFFKLKKAIGPVLSASGFL